MAVSEKETRKLFDLRKQEQLQDDKKIMDKIIKNSGENIDKFIRLNDLCQKFDRDFNGLNGYTMRLSE